MGMYDDFVVDYNLPMPEDPNGFSGTRYYQTKDLNCALDLYVVKDDGTVWLKKTEGQWIAGDPKGKSFSDKFGHFETQKQWEEFYKHTFSIDMCGYVCSEEKPYDYWIDYKISFVDGVIKEVSLKKFEATDNSERKKSVIKMEEEMTKRQKFQNTFRYKYFYKYYNRFIHFSFRHLTRVISFISSKLWSLERKLSI